SVHVISMCVFFFFSSRRRHTRFSRDWSSDVCSSDLTTDSDRVLPAEVAEGLVGFGHLVRVFTLLHGTATAFGGVEQLTCEAQVQIGRASCRERESKQVDVSTLSK